jgi:hypothetical protein
MKFAVSGMHGWPVGAQYIEAGTIIDTSLSQWAWLLNSALSGGRVPPPDVQALDQATYNAMVAAYGYARVLYGPGIVPVTS